jgi:hypothetical protein
VLHLRKRMKQLYEDIVCQWYSINKIFNENLFSKWVFMLFFHINHKKSVLLYNYLLTKSENDFKN